MDKNIGKKLDGRYEITELIGVGGMALHTHLDRSHLGCVIKPVGIGGVGAPSGPAVLRGIGTVAHVTDGVFQSCLQTAETVHGRIEPVLAGDETIRQIAVPGLILHVKIRHQPQDRVCRHGTVPGCRSRCARVILGRSVVFFSYRREGQRRERHGQYEYRRKECRVEILFHCMPFCAKSGCGICPSARLPIYRRISL